ncbi:uncharacterized protein LOC121421661 [Lytechinus variegatus]|uniref:uncharacterized protein LOC121421661 n=1 Tax=Lytechinus variegatus TaxID=7654 RepID=UPI001BB1A67E|nr:uncharacterized protein LOC121421661 [Lytechinus variegatus]XP_041472372.1 uncharacterized protein LOC121421661 [Lytechinus variegatus]
MAYPFDHEISASSVVGARAVSLHQSSVKEQRKLEDNLQSLSKEMRSRMNQLDSETSEMRRHAVRMFDSVRRKEHQRMTQSRQEIANLHSSGSSDDIASLFSGPSSRANSAGRLKTAQLPRRPSKSSDGAPSQISLSRCYSSPASIDKVGPTLDVELATEPKGDFSDESIAADAASIPVTDLPNFCTGRELGMIGEMVTNEDVNESNDNTVLDHKPNHSKVESSPLLLRRHSQTNLNLRSTSNIGDERAKLMTRRRRTSDIVKPVTTAAGVKPSRRHSSHEPAFLTNTAGTRSNQELLLHRTSSVNLPPLRHPSYTGRRSVHSDSQIMSPPLSPNDSPRSVVGARHNQNASFRRASHTESSPCIMKQTFASTPRRSVSQVVGELVHIEEIRRHSRGTSLQDGVRKARGALQSKSFPFNSTQRADVACTSMSKTQSLGDIFDELKDCRYLRISNQDSTA